MTTSEPTALRPASELDRTSEEFVWLWDSTHQSWVWMMQEAAWNHWNYRPEQYPVFVMADVIPRPHGEPAVFVPPTCDDEIYLKAESVGREHERTD